MNPRAAIVLFCLLICFGGATPAAGLAPGDASIVIGGEPGKQSETHTIRFEQAKDEKPPDLVFTPGDLERCVPTRARIDRSQVHVRPVAGEAGLYEVAVAGLPERYGSYTGKIEVADRGGKAYPAIWVTLLVRVPSTQVLSAVPPNLVVPLAKGDPSVSAALSNYSSKGTAAVVVSGLPSGAEIGDVRKFPLMSSRGYGEFPGDYGPEKKAWGMVFHADASQARPDKYSGVVELVLAGSERRITVPVEVNVRASPLRVLVMLVLGLVLGRAAKWMSEQGEKLLAAQRAIDDIALRAAGFEPAYRRHLDDRLASLRRLLGQRRLAEVDASMADVLARAELLERAGSLRRLAEARANVGAQAELDTLAQDLQFVGKPATLQSRLDAVEAGLLAAPAAADGMADAAPPAVRDTAPARRFIPMRWVGAARTGLEVAGALLLVGVGYEVLYLNGPPTFGANVSDYFGALVWGLSADVAARGIGSLGRVIPR